MFSFFGVYGGAVLAFAGLVVMIHPFASLGLPTRIHGLALFAFGLLLVIITMTLPAGEKQITTVRTRLDEFVPRYQFSEFHSIKVHAPAATVYRAMKQVPAKDIRCFRLLTWIRRGGRPLPEGILHAPENEPLMDVAMRTTFMKLAEDEGRELVVGTLVMAPAQAGEADRTPAAFRSLNAPGFAKAALNFRIIPDGDSASIVTTETRVFATDAGSRRKFARYWRVILPGSALIRRSWLQAIRRRAEAEILTS